MKHPVTIELNGLTSIPVEVTAELGWQILRYGKPCWVISGQILYGTSSEDRTHT